jgi:hypothetical protein
VKVVFFGRALTTPTQISPPTFFIVWPEKGGEDGETGVFAGDPESFLKLVRRIYEEVLDIKMIKY